MGYWSIYTYIGIVFVQTIFITYQLIIFRRREFGWYLLYTVFISIYLVFQAAPHLNPLKSTITEYEKFTLNRGIICLVIAFYYRFGRHFTGMASLYPKHNFFLVRFEYCMMAFGVADIITSYFNGGYYFPDEYIKYLILGAALFSFYIIGFLALQKNILIRILVTGSFIVLLSGTICLIDMMATNLSKSGLYYMRYHIVGVTLEFVFLNYGLILKSKMVEKEKIRLELEKQLAVLKERERIIADLHDDVGGGLSSIRIMSDLLTEKKDRLQNPEKYSQKISDTAKDISQKMNTLIWALNAENDSLQNFAEYVRQYAVQYFDGTGISVDYKWENNSPAVIELNGNHRKVMFLCIKEILNNALKYSKADKINISLAADKNKILNIKVSDNGIGLQQHNQFGNGLKNLKKRMDDLSGILMIDGNKGTTIILSVPLKN